MLLSVQPITNSFEAVGGHAPVIVAEDVDVELAVRCAGALKFRNSGEVCISPTGFLLHARVRDVFTRALVGYAGSLKVGNVLAQDTQMHRRVDRRQSKPTSTRYP